MKFDNKAQEETYNKVVAWMTEIFGEFAKMRDDFPEVAVLRGSAITQTIVVPWGDDEAVICTRSYVVTGAELTNELMQFLLRENCDMRFGGFGIDKEGDIIFEHAIVGSRCDKEELKASIFAVSSTADHYDDQIVERWGGQTALDVLRS
jgi:hypothetical protein